ncbi:hypothetical protein [Arcicella rosea]|uniref:Hemerythrin-like domain-containing protein n=1 Tax=Arcicella rosea TaxID=502909 RepID=A0A841EIA9_9BACT|nr:hypothetical protein [Arcicella rosea]MBB6002716.1 hemerythrin-like domain-containing protein [Arcicella rosea]
MNVSRMNALHKTDIIAEGDKSLLENEQKDSLILLSIVQQMENHIRFEERVVFNLIQEVIGQKQIEQIESNFRNQPFIEYEDPFWEV